MENDTLIRPCFVMFTILINNNLNVVDMTEIEEWRPIVGYEGLYEVSNLGRVRSFKWGREEIRKLHITKKGYLEVGLCKEGKQKMFKVHRLVAQAFIPNPEGLPVINHRDENPKNNKVDNLEWCTYKYNSNYGTCKERIVQTMISNGNADPEMCGIQTKDKKKYNRLYQQKNRENIRKRKQLYGKKNRGKLNEYNREYYQKNRDQINERRRERRRQKQKQTT